MKLKAYDKYGKQHLIIDLGDDEIYTNWTSSNSSGAAVNITVTLDKQYYAAHPGEYAEDPEFKRWSDLTDVEVMEGSNE